MKKERQTKAEAEKIKRDAEDAHKWRLLQAQKLIDDIRRRETEKKQSR
jgi:hypothetical protein